MDSTDPGGRLRHLAWPLCAVGLLTVIGTAALAFANRSAMHSTVIGRLPVGDGADA